MPAPKKAPGSTSQRKLKPTTPITKAKHLCDICTSDEREEIERKYVEGWLLRDILCEHQKTCHTVATLKEHIKRSGIDTEKVQAQRTSIRNFCTKVMQSAIPKIEAGKVTVGDGLDAAKILARLGEDDRIDQIWKIVLDKGNQIEMRGTNAELPEPNIKSKFEIEEMSRELEYTRQFSPGGIIEKWDRQKENREQQEEMEKEAMLQNS